MKTDATAKMNESHEGEERLTFHAFLNRIYREWANCSINEFSRQVGISRPTLMKWLRDPDIQPEFAGLKRMSDCSKISFLYLVSLAYPESSDELDISSYDYELAQAHRRLDSFPKRDRTILSQVILNYQPR